MRTLIRIPTIHHPSEASPGLSRHFTDPRIEELARLSNRVFDIIHRDVDTLQIDWSRVKLFSEGRTKISTKRFRPAAVTPDEVRNQIKLEALLIEKGARLQPTEGIVAWELTDRAEKITEHLVPLFTKMRDKSIAKKINAHLGEDETGILIMGAVHNVEGYLDPDIQSSILSEDLRLAIDAAKGELMFMSMHYEGDIYSTRRQERR